MQIKAKYGEQGMRVFKVLGDAEELQMEQRTVADKALIVEKVCVKYCALCAGHFACPLCVGCIGAVELTHLR